MDTNTPPLENRPPRLPVPEAPPPTEPTGVTQNLKRRTIFERVRALCPGALRLPGRIVPGQNKRTAFWLWRVAIPLLLLGVLIPVWRANTGHAHPSESAPAKTRPVVSIVRVSRGDLWNEVTIAAEFRPYAEAELHAKVSGYVEKLYADFGDQVKAGQLLAKLEVPELRNELDSALAALKRAEADYHSAHLAYTRLKAVDQQRPNLVAQQELDAAEAKDQAMEAVIAGAKAQMQKEQTLLDYTQITAPFSGVITSRYADPGALIQSGTASRTQSLPLFRLADNYRLRLDFPVSVTYVQDIRLGDPVEVRVETLGGKSFTGVISRFSHQVNEETRTMTTEIEVPNPNLELLPGMYAQVVLRVQKHDQVLSIPVEAVPSEKQATVLLVNAQQQIEERPITLGLETAARYEVKAGLKEGDSVIVGNRSELRPGEQVTPKPVETLAKNENAS